MRSPCNKICSMDFETGYCQGCLRTLDEIGNWSRYSDEERESVYSRIKNRKNGKISESGDGTEITDVVGSG